MKTNIYKIAAIDFIFISLSLASGSIGNAIIGRIMYYLAFILPILLGFIAIKKNDEKLSDKEAKEIPISFLLSKDKAKLILPLIFPSIAVIALISFATAFILSLLGYGSTADLGGSFHASFAAHALFPAVAEEILFRFIPLRLLSDNKKCGIIFSSLMFSLSHMSLFQLPYAFAAGIILAAADVFSNSVIPSFAIHLLNNTVSLLFSYEIGTPILIAVISAFTLSSAVFLVLKRKEYREFKELFKGDLDFLYPPIFIFAAFSIIISVLKLT